MDEVKKIYNKLGVPIAEIPLNDNGIFKEYYESSKLKSTQIIQPEKRSILKRYDENGNHIDKGQKILAAINYILMILPFMFNGTTAILAGIISAIMIYGHKDSLYNGHFLNQLGTIGLGTLYWLGAFVVSLVIEKPMIFLFISIIIWAFIAFKGVKGLIALVRDEETSYVGTQHFFIGDYADNGLAAICINDKCGFINQNGEIIISMEYDNAHKFLDNNLARVKQNGKEFYINSQGKKIEQNNNDNIGR